MSTLTISGDGKLILFQEIDEETAERYAELGIVSEEISDLIELVMLLNSKRVTS